jgi:cytoskeletal protein CcmA (bactofilin family)
MFEKSKSRSTENLGKTNRIVEGTTITGDIISQADFRLDGHLIGNFTSNGKLVIGQAGSLKGQINCKNADIEGKFEGKINIEEMLSIKSTSEIIGDVQAAKLSVEPGALFTATCVMKSSVKSLPQNSNGKQEKTA